MVVVGKRWLVGNIKFLVWDVFSVKMASKASTVGIFVVVDMVCFALFEYGICFSSHLDG